PPEPHRAVRRLHGRPGRSRPAEPRMELDLPGGRPHPAGRRGQRAARADRQRDILTFQGGGKRQLMAEDLAERVAELEKSVKRAVEVIAALRQERDALGAKLVAVEAERRELQSLRQERKDVLQQVDSILKELDKLDL